MLRKLLLYFKCVVLNGTRNPIRFFLSIFGVFISMVLLSYAIFFLDAYYNGSMEKVEIMPDDAFILSGFNEDMYQTVCDGVTYAYPHKLQYLSEASQLYLGQYNEKGVAWNASTVGISTQDDTSVYIYAEQPYITSLTLLDGRLISNEDIRNNNRVVVIDEYTATLLFADKSPIGQTLNIEKYDKKYTYEIIGVISANYDTEREFSSLRSKIKSTNEDELIVVDTTIYIPSSVFEEDYQEYEKESVLLWTGLDEDTMNNCEAEIKNLLMSSYEDNISDKSTVKSDVLIQLNYYKKVFALFFIVVFLFSGLNTMNIFFFSVKERVVEIGIRKAYGASKENIIMQFITESFLVSVIATCLAVFVSVILIVSTMNVVSDYEEIVLIFKFKPILFALTFFTAIFQGIVFSIIPSIYASSISVVKALRFE